MMNYSLDKVTEGIFKYFKMYNYSEVNSTKLHDAAMLIKNVTGCGIIEATNAVDKHVKRLKEPNINVLNSCMSFLEYLSNSGQFDNYDTRYTKIDIADYQVELAKAIDKLENKNGIN